MKSNPIPEEYLAEKQQIADEIENLGDLQCRSLMTQVIANQKKNIANGRKNEELSLLSDQWQDVVNLTNKKGKLAIDYDEINDLFKKNIQTATSLFPDQLSLTQDSQFTQYIQSFLNTQTKQNLNYCAKTMRDFCDYLNFISQSELEDQQEYFTNFPPSSEFLKCLEGTQERVGILLRDLTSTKDEKPFIAAHERAIRQLTDRVKNSVDQDYESHVFSYIEYSLGITAEEPGFSPQSQILIQDAIRIHRDYHKIFKDELAREIFTIDRTLEGLQDGVAKNNFFIDKPFEVGDKYPTIAKTLAQYATNGESFLRDATSDETVEQVGFEQDLYEIDHNKIHQAFTQNSLRPLNYLRSFKNNHPDLAPIKRQQIADEPQQQPIDNIDPGTPEQARTSRSLNTPPPFRQVIQAPEPQQQPQPPLKSTQEYIDLIQNADKAFFSKEVITAFRNILKTKNHQDREAITIGVETLWMMNSKLLGNSPAISDEITKSLGSNDRGFFFKIASNSLPNQKEKFSQIKSNSISFFAPSSLGSQLILHGSTTEDLKKSIESNIDLFLQPSQMKAKDYKQFAARTDLDELLTFLQTKKNDAANEQGGNAKELSDNFDIMVKRLAYYSIGNGNIATCQNIIDKYLDVGLFHSLNPFKMVALKGAKAVTDFTFDIHQKLFDQTDSSQTAQEKELLRLEDLSSSLNQNISNSTPLEAAVESDNDHFIRRALASLPTIKANDFIHQAAQDNSLNVFSLLIRQGADVISCDQYERSPIFYAITKNHEEIVDLIIQESKDNVEQLNLYVTDFNGNETNPLLEILEKGQVNMLQKFIDAGIDLYNDKNSFNGSAIHHATFYRSHKLIPILKKAGIDINAIDQDGATAIMLSLNNDDSDCLRSLIQEGAELPSSLLEIASTSDNHELHKTLLTTADNITQNTFLHQCALQNIYPDTLPPDTISELLVKKNLEGLTPITLALSQRNFDFLSSLQSQNCDFFNLQDDNAENIFHHIVKMPESSLLENIKDFIRQNSEKMSYPKIHQALFAPNNDQDSILDIAARNSNLEILSELIDVQIINDAQEELNPLFKAIQRQDITATNNLLTYDIDFAKPINTHGSFLNQALATGNLEIVKLLVEKGANPKQANEQGEDALSYADKFHEGNQELKDYLISKTKSTDPESKKRARSTEDADESSYQELRKTKRNKAMSTLKRKPETSEEEEKKPKLSTSVSSAEPAANDNDNTRLI